MFRFIFATFFALFAGAAFAESANEHCKMRINETDGYVAGFGTVELSGPPLQLDGWGADMSIMNITFPDGQEVSLTHENTFPGTLADYIGTALMEREEGHEPFVAKTTEEFDSLLVLVQPFDFEGTPGCLTSGLNIAN